MIDDSSYWKEDLLKTANFLLEITRRRKPSQRLLVNLEKEIFLAAYIVRKLMDSKLLSTASEVLPVATIRFKNKGKPVTILNWQRVDSLYDFENGEDRQLTLREFCNQIVHSYVFLPMTTSATGPIRWILFCSDRLRNKYLFQVSLSILGDLLKTVGLDYPACASFKFDQGLADYRVMLTTPIATCGAGEPK